MIGTSIAAITGWEGSLGAGPQTWSLFLIVVECRSAGVTVATGLTLTLTVRHFVLLSSVSAENHLLF